MSKEERDGRESAVEEDLFGGGTHPVLRDPILDQRALCCVLPVLGANARVLTATHNAASLFHTPIDS